MSCELGDILLVLYDWDCHEIDGPLLLCITYMAIVVERIWFFHTESIYLLLICISLDICITN